ncbi:MAG: hypothetical protein AAF198_12105 [Pseudomonadota bacterium]
MNFSQLPPWVHHALRAANQLQLGLRHRVLHGKIVQSKQRFEAEVKAQKQQSVPEKIIRIAGMPRSGNHAVISWLTHALGTQNVIFFNNCAPAHHLTEFAQCQIDDRVIKGRNLFSGTGLSKRSVEHVLEQTCKRPIHIVSYERQDLDVVLGDFTNVSAHYTSTPSVTDLIVYRHPLNWLASYYKVSLQRRPTTWTSEIFSAFDQYIEYVDKALVQSSIYYDRWVYDKDYQEQILADFGAQNASHDLGQTSTFGWGSSFAGTRDDPNPKALTSRWKSLLEDENFETYVLSKLSDQHWRWMGKKFQIRKDQVFDGITRK